MKPIEILRVLDTTATTCDAFEALREGRQVFVKKLKRQYAHTPLYREALEREFKIASSLSHPSVARYFEYEGDMLIMEFIEGNTLHSLFQTDSPEIHKDKNIANVTLRLLSAIEYLHTQRIVHGDIKPDNIMINTKSGELIVIDFDKATRFDPKLSAGNDGAPIDTMCKGEETEAAFRRAMQLDIRGARRIIETLALGAAHSKLKERLLEVLYIARQPGATIRMMRERLQQ